MSLESSEISIAEILCKYSRHLSSETCVTLSFCEFIFCSLLIQELANLNTAVKLSVCNSIDPQYEESELSRWRAPDDPRELPAAPEGSPGF